MQQYHWRASPGLLKGKGLLGKRTHPDKKHHANTENRSFCHQILSNQSTNPPLHRAGAACSAGLICNHHGSKGHPIS
jgi:hypothetical protein